MPTSVPFVLMLAAPICLTSVLNFIRSVGKTVEKAEKSAPPDLARFAYHSRPAPPHAGIYCLECGAPMRPETVYCAVCATGNPLQMSGTM